MQTNEIAENTKAQGLIPFAQFLSGLGRSTVTGWRWRKQGWLKTINVAGRLYVSQLEIHRFEQRAAAGEFAKEHVAPGRQG